MKRASLAHALAFRQYVLYFGVVYAEASDLHLIVG